jgi:hypothetical protein
MKAKQLIKDIQRAILESGEYDPDLVINTRTELTGRIQTVATPLQQGEQEYFVVLNIMEDGV